MYGKKEALEVLRLFEYMVEVTGFIFSIRSFRFNSDFP